MRKTIIFLAALLAAATLGAQDCAPDERWEAGVGVSAFQFQRIRLGSFSTDQAGHRIDMQLRQVAWAANLSLVRPLDEKFAIDFQSAIGAADKKLLFQAGVGLQWRVGHYFDSRQIDPYLRIGANYLYKGFNTQRGIGFDDAGRSYRTGADGRHLFTAAFGAGMNLWLDERFGVGMQGDYLLIPKRGVANSLQGTLRLMWRLDGQ